MSETNPTGISSPIRGTQLLTMRDLCERLRLGRTTIYGVMRSDPTFPEPFRVVGNSLRWDAADLARWVTSRKSAHRADVTLPADSSGSLGRGAQ